MKKSLFFVFAAGFLLVLGCNFQRLQLQSEEYGDPWIGQVRVIWTEQPQQEAIVSWTSGMNSKENYIEIAEGVVSRVAPHFSRKKEISKGGKITYGKWEEMEGVPSAYYRHVFLDQLKPGRPYSFRVCSDGFCSAVYYFKTAPDQPGVYSFLAGGDARTGKEHGGTEDKVPHTSRQEMNKLVKDLVEQDPEIYALIHGADFAGTAQWRHLYYWLEDLSYMVGKDGRILPLIISQGNHDLDAGFYENFWLGEIGEGSSENIYYPTQLAPGICLLTLNTETAMAGDQRVWLEDQLRKRRGENAWLFVQYHKPAYPAVKDFTREDFARVRQLWVPLFERYRIDLAIESDGHALKKTLPILEGKPHEQGIRYIGEGGMGVPQRKAMNKDSWYFQGDGFAGSHHHVWKLSVGPDTTFAQAIGLNGTPLHAFPLLRRKPQ
jgi:acid phosphatase type 7